MYDTILSPLHDMPWLLEHAQSCSILWRRTSCCMYAGLFGAKYPQLRRSVFSFVSSYLLRRLVGGMCVTQPSSVFATLCGRQCLPIHEAMRVPHLRGGNLTNPRGYVRGGM